MNWAEAFFGSVLVVSVCFTFCIVYGPWAIFYEEE